MKRSSRIRKYIKRFGPLLIVGVLIMGLASCDGSCSSAPAEYELNTSSSGGGEVVIPGEGTYADGTVVMLEAVADECYEFVKWTGANVTDPYSPITTITMDEAKSITAHFALLSYDLTVSSTDGGAVTSPGEDTYTYDCGTVVALVAAAQEGYYFVNWSGDVGTIANTNAPTITITMMGDYSITANFEEIPPGQFVLTTSSTVGGSVTTPGEDSSPYNKGTVVDLEAVADECYEFVNWTGDTVADPNSAATNITMDGAKNVTANFALLSYNLTADSTDGGKVTSPGEDTSPYDCGTVVDLVAEADECYEFVNWTGDTVADPNSATTTITMDGAKNVTANFALLSYNLTADSTDGGDVSSPGEGTFPYDCGTVVDLVAEEEEGYSFVEWSGDVGTIADIDAAETTITMNSTYTITANFGLFAGGNGTAYVGYEDSESGDFDYNDFGMSMSIEEVYLGDCLHTISMTFESVVYLANDIHDIHILRTLSSSTAYNYTITRTTVAQGTETPEVMNASGQGNFDIVLFDSDYYTLGDTITINIEITSGCESYDPTPEPPRWDLAPIFTYYDPYMNNRTTDTEYHIGDWQPATSPLPWPRGYDVPYVLVVPVTGWEAPEEGERITNPYPDFDDYYKTGSPENWYE